MKPVVTLLFLLFFSLLGSCSGAHATTPTDGNYFSTHAPLERIQPLKIIHQPGLYTTNSSPDNNPPVDFLCIEEDDSQDDVNKPVSASRYYIAFYYAFFLSNPNSAVTNFLLFYKSLFYPAPGKYITLRSLRI